MAVSLGLAAVALVARLAYVATVKDHTFDKDADHLHQIAVNLADGLGFVHPYPELENHPTAFRPPLFPMALSLWYRVFGTSQLAGRAFAICLGVAVVIATYLVVRRWANNRSGMAAALLVAIYPPLIANDVVPLTEGLSLLLMVLLIDSTLARRWWAAGVLVGALMLTRPSAQLLLVAILAWFLLRAGWRRALGVAGVAVLVISPWVIRNQVVLGEPVIVTSNGFNLAAVYSPAAQDSRTFIDPTTAPAFADMRLDQFQEGNWDRKLTKIGLDNLRRDPLQVLPVVGSNTLSFFELRPASNDPAESYDGRNLKVRSYTLPLFYVVTTAGFMGLWLLRRSDLAKLSALLAALFAGGSLVFIAPPRLRAPFDLIMCIGAGALFDWVVQRRRRGSDAVDQDGSNPPTVRGEPTTDMVLT